MEYVAGRQRSPADLQLQRCPCARELGGRQQNQRAPASGTRAASARVLGQHSAFATARAPLSPNTTGTDSDGCSVRRRCRLSHEHSKLFCMTHIADTNRVATGFNVTVG